MHLQHPACAPMKIPDNDQFHSKYNITCQNYIRSQTVLLNNCDLGITKQVKLQLIIYKTLQFNKFPIINIIYELRIPPG